MKKVVLELEKTPINDKEFFYSHSCRLHSGLFVPQLPDYLTNSTGINSVKLQMSDFLFTTWTQNTSWLTCPKKKAPKNTEISGLDRHQKPIPESNLANRQACLKKLFDVLIDKDAKWHSDPHKSLQCFCWFLLKESKTPSKCEKIKRKCLVE